jgi:hypothetical protein
MELMNSALSVLKQSFPPVLVNTFKMGRLRGGPNGIGAKGAYLSPIRRDVACSGHSTRFLTPARVFARV